MFALLPIAVKAYRYSSSHRYTPNLASIDMDYATRLTFRQGQTTVNRRYQSGPQLRPRRFADPIQSVTCTRDTFLFFFVLEDWTCQANDPNVKIVDYNIVCEGWDGDYDNNVVEGSCYLEYDAVYNPNSRYYTMFGSDDYLSYYRRYQTINKFYDNGRYRTTQNLQPIALNDIDILVFEEGQQTTSRKGQYYDQLQPQRGNKYKPTQVVCSNHGNSDSGPVWKCHANLPNRYTFEKAHVSCEGWNGPGDSNIVPGSCLLEYKIA